MNANRGSLLRKPGITLGVLIISALVALFWISGILNPAPVAADDATFYLDCPTTEVTEGGSVDVYLVRVTDHEHDDSFGAYWYTQVRSAVGADFYGFHGNYYSSTEEEQLTGRSARAIVTRQDGLVEGNEYFEVSIDRPTGALAENQHSNCNITIIDDDPRITEVEVTSSPAWDDTYGLGETIEISATFSAPVKWTAIRPLACGPAAGRRPTIFAVPGQTPWCSATRSSQTIVITTASLWTAATRTGTAPGTTSSTTPLSRAWEPT